MGKNILAIDHGTSGIKAAIVSNKGEVIDFEFRSNSVTYLDGGGAEQDPEDWWVALLQASKVLISRAKVPVGSITAISVSSTFSTTVAVDQEGNYLMKALTWMDSRGAPYIKKIANGFPSVNGYGLLNAFRWIRKTGGGPQLSGKDDIAHILFLKNEYRKIYDQTYKFLPSKDYLNLRLTGKFAASYDSMTLFWMSDSRDPNNIHYDNKLIKCFGIDRDKLPEMKNSIDILGDLKSDIAKEIGLKPGVNVVVGTPDHQAAQLGSGAVRDYEGHVYVGTSSWVESIVPFKKTDMFHSIASLPTAIPGKYQCINEQDIAGGSLSFLLNNIIFYKGRLRDGVPPDDSYEIMDIVASSIPAGSNNIIFTPWLNGERSPVDDKNLRGGLHNISLKTNADHIIRAVLEGVAYNTKWNLFYVEKFIGREMEVLNFIGGGAKSDVWCQIFADVLNRKIRRVKDPIESNARGAAFVASVAMGYISFEEIPDLIEYDKVFEPNQNNRIIYDKLYKEFLNIYKKNRSIYKRLNG